MPSSITIISSSSENCSHLSMIGFLTTSSAPAASANPLPSPSFSPTCSSKRSGLLCQEARALSACHTSLLVYSSCVFHTCSCPVAMVPSTLSAWNTPSLFMWLIVTAPWAFTAASPYSVPRAGTWWWFLFLFVFFWFGFIFALQYHCHCPE